MDPNDDKHRKEDAMFIDFMMLVVLLLALFYLLKWLLGVPGRVWSWLWDGSTEGAVKESADERRSRYLEGTMNEPNAERMSWYLEGAINEPAAQRDPWSWLRGESTVHAIHKPAAVDEPWCLQPHRLGQWYNDNIKHGTTQFDTDCREAVDTVIRYLHRVCSTYKDLCNVSKVVKGGSLGKGTMVKDLSDVDLVAFINPPHMRPLWLTDPKVYQNNLKVVLEKLEAALRGHPSVRINRRDSYLVNFSVEIRSCAADFRWVDVDLLPTTLNNAGCSLDSLFTKMLQMPSYDRSFYSAYLVELQRDFVKKQPVHVKELIRLVKYWAYICLPPALRKSYPLELITIHRWEKAGSPSQFKKVQGLRDVLETLTDLLQLRTYWVEHYDATLAKCSIEELGLLNPIVLDPANPTSNVCWVYQRFDKRKVIHNAAAETLSSEVLRSVVVTSNWSGRY